MRRILVATDFSERSDRALRRAVLLARQSGASLTIVHGLDNDRPPRIVDREKREAEILLHELTATLKNVDGIESSGRIILAEASQAVLRAAQEDAPDLLIIGPHRRQIFRDVFVGTTAERTIRAASCPVLMANAAPVGPYRHVLMTTDLSEVSRDAVVAYLRLELAKQARQSALHIFDVPMLRLAMLHELPKDEEEAYLADQRATATRALTEFLASTRAAGIHPLLRHEANIASYEILAAAEEARADLIVVGTHSKRGLERMLLGSVTERVLRDSTIDVLAIPPARLKGLSTAPGRDSSLRKSI